LTSLIFIAFFLLSVYLIVLTWLAIGFIRTPYSNQQSHSNSFTIIISARNEEQTILRCLDSISKQHYPKEKIQLILIDDGSTDQTYLKSNNYLLHSGLDYTLLKNSFKKGKKASITLAMQHAKHPHIITRDADTFSSSTNWLSSISGFIENNASDFIIAPVSVSNNIGLLWAMQAIENNILTLVSVGSTYFQKSFLCSSANLIFKKNIFEATKGYSSHAHIPSGDDVLFMEDVKKVGGKIAYLTSKDAMVFTYPCYSFTELFIQKIRWASKFIVNKNWLNFSLAVITFLTNLVWIFCFITVLIIPQTPEIALVFVLVKLVFDFLLLFLASSFIKNKYLLWYSLPAGCIYPIYASFIAIGSLLIKPKWKN
jgi:glycosyltransferase involved in cell wall biosynthesis